MSACGDKRTLLREDDTEEGLKDDKRLLLPGGLNGKESACQAGHTGSIPGSGRSPGEANYSSILAWEIPWTGEPGGLPSMGSQKNWTQFSD